MYVTGMFMHAYSQQLQRAENNGSLCDCGIILLFDSLKGYVQQTGSLCVSAL